MKTITVDEIMNLFERGGLDPTCNHRVRTSINTGTLSNKLNSNLGLRKEQREKASDYDIFSAK